MASQTKPLISVVIPVYNRGPLLRATLDSALNQELDQSLAPEAVEVIVVDDGSTDGSADLVQQFYGGDKRLRLLRQENMGMAASRNRGLQEARGEYIAFLDHDDVWLPTKLQLQLQAFEDRPDVGVVYCLWSEVDEMDNPLPDDLQMTRQSWWVAQTGHVHHWVCQPRNPIISMSVPMIRIAALRAVKGFDPHTVPADDWDLWMRLARHWKFQFVPEELVLYRRHSAQVSTQTNRMMLAMHRAIIKQWPFLLTRPRMLWFALSLKYFIPTMTSYVKAKDLLFEGHLRQSHLFLLKMLLRFPLLLLTPQWLYFALRLMRRKTERY